MYEVFDKIDVNKISYAALLERLKEITKTGEPAVAIGAVVATLALLLKKLEVADDASRQQS